MLNRLLLIATMALCACSSGNQPSEKGRLFNEKWYLISMDGTKLSDIPRYKNYTISIEKNKISGNAINQFIAAARINTDDTMQVSRLQQTTRKATLGREAFLENQYFSIISTLTRWKKIDGRLELTGRKGKLIFRQ